MKTISFLAVIGILSVSCYADVDFVGCIRFSDGYRFALVNHEAGSSSAWLKAGQTWEGFTVDGFEPASQTLIGHDVSRSYRLSLSGSSIRPPDAAKVDPDRERIVVELTDAKNQLQEMRGYYLDAHPLVKAQLVRIAALEPPLAPGESADLRLARVELALMRLRYMDTNPKVVGQLKVIDELEGKSSK